MICMKPKPAKLKNHIAQIGPKNLPIKDVPCFCIANKPMMIPMAMGNTYSCSFGETTFKPSTADKIDTAGVITESP